MRKILLSLFVVASMPLWADTQSVTIDSTTGAIKNNSSLINVPSGVLGGSFSSSQLALHVSDETGTGSLVFAGSPAITGSPTLAGNALNTAGGLVTGGVSGNSAQIANTNFIRLLAGFNGPFETGLERGFLSASLDGLTWSTIHGLENFNPPVAGDGVRDICITKIGSTYFIAHSVSFATGIRAYFGVVSSPDLVNWTWVVSPSYTSGDASPKFFRDTDGSVGVVAYKEFIPSTDPTGLTTWGSPTTMTFTDGTTLAVQDSMLIKVGSTYGFFYANSSATTTFRIGTSSSKTSGYAEVGGIGSGTITNWPSAEGVDVMGPDATGAYWAYMFAKSGPFNGTLVYSKTTTPLIPGSWSTVSQIPSNNFSSNSPLVSAIDNGGGFMTSDAQTCHDVALATEQYTQFWDNFPAAQGFKGFKYPLSITGFITAPTGTGTITSSGAAGIRTLTGTNTLFTNQLMRGSFISDGTHKGVIIRVISNTSATVLMYTAAFSANSFTYTTPSFSEGYSLNNPGIYTQGNDGGLIFDYNILGTGNSVTTYSPVWTDQTAAWGIGMSGGFWFLQELSVNPNNTPFVVGQGAPTSAFRIESTGLSTTTNFSFATAGNGIIGGATSTLPSAGKVGSLLTNFVTAGAPLSLTTATPANLCTQAEPAGHYLVYFQPTISPNAATMIAASPMQAAISTTSATLPLTYLVGSLSLPLTLASATDTIAVAPQYVTLTSPGTIYGVVNVTFTAGTVTAYGFLQVIQMP